MKILNESKTILFEMGVDFSVDDLVEKSIFPKKVVQEDAVRHHPENFYLKNEFIFARAAECGYSSYRCNYPLAKREGFDNLCAIIEIKKN